MSGKKRGRGSPSISRDGQRSPIVSLRLPVDVMEVIDAWAKARKTTRSIVIREICARAVEAKGET